MKNRESEAMLRAVLGRLASAAEPWRFPRLATALREVEDDVQAWRVAKVSGECTRESARPAGSDGEACGEKQHSCEGPLDGPDVLPGQGVRIPVDVRPEATFVRGRRPTNDE